MSNETNNSIPTGEEAPEMDTTQTDAPEISKDTDQEEKQPVQFFNVRDHGYTNGLQGLEGQHYPEFLEHFQKAEAIEQLLAQNATARKMLTEQRNSLQNAEEAAREAVLTSKQAASQSGKKLELANDFVQTLCEKHKALKETYDALMDKHRSDYTLLGGLIFLVFALLFMGADIGISYSIIATNLEMHGLEGLLLAVGIGGLSVAIKPLYDRMAEKRLHHEKHQLQGNKWSFIIVSVLTVVAVICCVGMFAYLRTDILAQTTASTDPATFTDGISVPQSENPYNPWAAWYTQAGMIAAGLVFIFGGTICMSIAIPVLFRNRKTHSWNRKSTKLQLEIDIAEDAVKPIAIETDMNVVAMHAAEETLGKIRGKIAQLEDPRNLEARRDELQAELAKEKTAQNIASYHDAYERGRASSDAEGSPTTSGPRRRRTERPWVEVRRLLAEHRRRQSIVPLVEETA